MTSLTFPSVSSAPRDLLWSPPAPAVRGESVRVRRRRGPARSQAWLGRGGRSQGRRVRGGRHQAEGARRRQRPRGQGTRTLMTGVQSVRTVAACTFCSFCIYHFTYLFLSFQPVVINTVQTKYAPSHFLLCTDPNLSIHWKKLESAAELCGEDRGRHRHRAREEAAKFESSTQQQQVQTLGFSTQPLGFSPPLSPFLFPLESVKW